MLTDHRASELYAAFLQARRQCTTLPLAPYPRDFTGEHWGFSFPFIESAGDRVRELANEINSFARQLRATEAWWEVFQPLAPDEQIEILLEHLLHLAAVVIDAPYAIRSRIIDAVCVTSDIANRVCRRPVREISPRTRTTFTVAAGVASGWRSWPVLAKALSGLNSSNLTTATNDYRNARHHGHPPAIAIGVNRYVRKHLNPAGRYTWAFGTVPPVDLGVVVPLLRQEHATSLMAFQALLELLREQKAELPEGF